MVQAIACLALLLASLSAARAGVELSTGKLLYDSHQPVRFEVKAAGLPAGHAFRVEVWDRRGVEPQRLLAAARLRTDAAGAGECMLTWNPGEEEYGHASEARVLSVGGRVVARSRPAIFEVCREWARVARMNAIHSWRVLGPDYPRAEIEKEAERRRWEFVNCMEVYEYKVTGFGLAPHEEVRFHDNHEDPNADAGRRGAQIAEPTVRAWVDAFHRQGIRTIGYCNMVTAPPELWRKTGRALDDDGKPYEIFFKGLQWYCPLAKPYAPLFAADLLESIKEYGWDGWFLDSVGPLFGVNAAGRDEGGKPITDWQRGDYGGDSYYRAWDAVADDFLAGLNREIRPRHPSFALVCNGIAEAVWRYFYWRKARRGMFRAPGEPPDDRKPFIAPRSSRRGPVWFYETSWGEVQEHKHPNLYWESSICWQSIKQAVRTPLWVIFPILQDENWYVPAVKPLLALLLANGLGVWDQARPHLYEKPLEDPVCVAQRDYYRFAARYGRYLYDPAIRWARPDTVGINAPQRVMWRDLVFRRDLPRGGREVYVHLLNLEGPPQETVMIGKHDAPPPVEGLEVRLPGRLRGARAFWLDADGSQEPVALAVEDGCVRLPRLACWGVLVLKAGSA